jgi:hypothetical protein
MMKIRVAQLIEEFEARVGLSPTEARRSAFIALAAAQGWNNARIGRYLGVHRVRIGQKLEKYQTYIESGEMPLLTEVMVAVHPGSDTTPGVVAFTQTDWENADFAMGMLALVADIEPGARAA